MISGTSAPRCAWCRARRGQSALGRAATAGRGRALSGVRKSAAYYGLALQALQRNSLAEAERNWTLASEDGRTSPQLARLSVDIALARKDNARALELAQAASSAGRTGARWASPMPRRCRMAAATPRPRTICAARSGNGARTSPASTRCWRRVRNAPASRCRRVATWPATTRRSAPSPRRSRSCSRRAGCLPTSTSSRRSTCRSRKSGQTGGRAAAA